MKRSRIIVWLITFVGLLLLSLVLQVPASWLLAKFAPNLRMLDNVSGNVWQGQASWQYQRLRGTVRWSTRPWELLRLRAASNVVIQSGQTELRGIVSVGLGKRYHVQHFDGKISPDTLSSLLPWQWPSASINVKDLNLDVQQKQGISAAQGQLSWAGGMLNYPIGQHFERIDIPPLTGELSQDKDKVKLLITDSQKQRLAELNLDKDLMLDVQITQRFLLHAPGYQGKAGLDSAVVTTRQPLSSLGNM